MTWDRQLSNDRTAEGAAPSLHASRQLNLTPDKKKNSAKKIFVDDHWALSRTRYSMAIGTPSQGTRLGNQSLGAWSLGTWSPHPIMHIIESSHTN